MLLYKYIDPNVLAIVEQLTLRVRDPKEFNDPFECRPGIIRFKTNLEKKQFLNNATVRDHYYEALLRKGHVRNKKQFKALWKAKRQSLLKVLDDVPAAVSKAWESVQTGRFFYILCLSDEIVDTHDEILMWSHYTSGHKGARLKIETDMISPRAFDQIRVNYVEKRPNFHTSDYIVNGHIVDRETVKSISTKSMAWKYEREYRLLFASEACMAEGEVRYIRMNPEALREVVIGCNAPHVLEQNLLALLKNDRFRHVEIKKAEVDPEEFRLRYVPVRV